MSLDTAHAEYAELRRRFFDATTAPKGARMVLTNRVDGNKVVLDRLLRHHRDGVVRDEETSYRDYLDELLFFYSVLEVASIAGVLTVETLPPEDRHTAVQVLTHPAVAKYYQRHYPLLLPTLFSRRLDGARLTDEGELSTPRFHEFLAVSRAIEGDESVTTFLWFLDSGKYLENGRWLSINDTVKALGSAEVTARLLRQKKPGRLAQSIDGFRTFAMFCQEFDALLRVARDHLLLRDAFWHAHAYWFQRVGKRLGATMDKALANLLRAASTTAVSGISGADVPNAERRALQHQLERTVKDLGAAVNRLTLRSRRPAPNQYGARLAALAKTRT